ncbi:5'/3'-nucleotidase SurE [Salsipaludibacter albus]|uniref:5'/3'-nucleotidase SurE n=1 Tax=Salsipaludibacter albus TaxID=2849650 RepID=UPI001EE3B7CE|nr:5'/3'-nucleotidase SurE [Salsipaludibacter albus]
MSGDPGRSEHPGVTATPNGGGGTGRDIDVDTRPTAAGDGRARVLVTNDDGIDSPGLQRLAVALAEDHDVVVAAPLDNRSGSGTGIGRLQGDEDVALRRHDVGPVEGWALAGPPGLAVMSAALGAFGARPDLVVSGINAGMNTGHSVIHSGTVGAALTAHTFGSGGVAVSLAPTRDPTRPHDDPEAEDWHWDTAVAVAVRVVAWALDHRPRTALNVNVPALPPDQVRGTRWARLDHFGHFRVATADLAGSRLHLDVTDRSRGREPESDTALCLDGWVTLTPLEPVETAEFPAVDPATVVPWT